MVRLRENPVRSRKIIVKTKYMMCPDSDKITAKYKHISSIVEAVMLIVTVSQVTPH